LINIRIPKKLFFISFVPNQIYCLAGYWIEAVSPGKFESIFYQKTKQKINEYKNIKKEVDEFIKDFNLEYKSIKREIKQNNLPFLVGGSGLYMNSITKGFFVPDVPPQNNLRRQLKELGQTKCWDLLKNCDPLSTKKINFADQIRTIRALEVFYVTGQPLSTLKVQKPPDWKILELGIDRDNLKERIFQRSKNMFSSGIIEETNHLISKYGFDLPILETIGYREAKDVLNNHSTIDQAIELTTTKTIQFAKRQKTWFRNKNNPLWLNNKNLLKDAIIKIDSFLS